MTRTFPEESRKTAPGALRWTLYLLNALFTVLLVYLLGFMLQDIVHLEGPDRTAINKQFLTPSLPDQIDSLNEEIADLEAQIQRQKEIQDNLRRSMENARTTMQEMMSLYRLSLERGVNPGESEKEALSTSQQRFLDAQNRFEDANVRISQLDETKHLRQEELQAALEQRERELKPATEEYNRRMKWHNFKVACFKLALIVPLLLLSAFLFYRFRGRPMRPVFGAALVATFWKTGTVMLDRFPREFFKYIAILAAIAIVLAFLFWVVKRITRPPRSTLIDRFREAYVRHRCPICAHPILRGPLKHAILSRKKLHPPTAPGNEPAGESEDPNYVCPSCGTRLYEPCENCRASRHSLLPFCAQCGQAKEVAA